ncbi:MAG: RDD family protein [Clostridia bacterium]|nr:RDD family protein [Clostridia bacterium]
MSFSLQKASFWKRISSYMLDTVALVFLILSLILVTNPIFKMDSHTKKLNEYRTQYAQEYGVDLDLANKNPSTLTEEEKAAYDANYEKYEAMNEAMAKDKTVQAVNADIIIAFAASFAVSVFFATLILHFFVPLLFKNGRTLGKRVFGLAVIRTNGVKISTPVLFIRSMVGLFAIETMFPLAILLMMLLGMLGLIGAIILVAFAILQIVCMITTQTNSSIHDLLTDSVVVDMASQTIYESNEDLIAAQKAEAAERAARAEGTAQPVQLFSKPADKSKDEK